MLVILLTYNTSIHIKYITKTIQSYIIRKRITNEYGNYMLNNLLISTNNMNDLKNCKLIIEAVIENMNIKHSIFKQLNTVLNNNNNNDCILCTNTSTLDIDKIATVLDKDKRLNFAGLHFFSPANIMKLIEIVISDKNNTTSIQTISNTYFCFSSDGAEAESKPPR